MSRSTETPKQRIKQGDIYLVNLPKQKLKGGLRHGGREMCGPHRCLVLQDESITKKINQVIVIPISSAKEKAERHTWVRIPAGSTEGVPKHSYIMCEQIRSLDKRRLKGKVGESSIVYMIGVQKILDFMCPSVLDVDVSEKKEAGVKP